MYWTETVGMTQVLAGMPRPYADFAAALLGTQSLLAGTLALWYDRSQLRSLFTRQENLFVRGPWEVAEAGMLSTLLVTKLHRPHPTPNLVARPRLTQRLDEGLQNDHRQFLLAAPQTMISVLPTEG